MTFNHNQILELDERFRRNLINSSHGAKTLVLVGSKSKRGVTNLAIFSQIIHIGANPPLVGLLFRPDSVERNTLDNIRSTGEYTIQNVRNSFYKKAHQTSARYAKDRSEFDACGFTEIYFKGFSAPFVGESNVKMGLSLKSETKIKENGTILLIGQIEVLSIEDELLGKDGYIDHFKAETSAGGGLDDYFMLTKLSRLTYAKPDQPINEIKE